MKKAKVSKVDSVLRDLGEAMDYISGKRPEQITGRDILAFVWKLSRLATLDNGDRRVQEMKIGLGQHFKERRETHGFSLRDVASRAGMTFPTIANIEKGTMSISSYPIAMLALEACIVESKESQEKEKAGTLPSISRRKSNVPA